MRRSKLILIFAVFSLVFIVGCKDTDYTAFAQCLADNDIKFYGAFWCPHCQSQKNMFGDSFNNINYIECSLPDRSGQTQVCEDAGIQAYPTWDFADGKRIEGELTFLQLSQLSGCTLSQS